MKTNHEHFTNKLRRTDIRNNEHGNALIYVLVAVALFAALSFTLGRQTDTDEISSLDDGKADLLATQLISYAAQARSVADQMRFTGTEVDDFDFILPTDPNFNVAPHIHKIYHPAGGGLNPGRIPPDAINQSITNPVAGWYLGRFNNVEWSATTGQDVILVAYQISQPICAKINEHITGSSAIPIMADSIRETMIDDDLYTGTNADLTTDDAGDVCPECDRVSSLCVQNQTQTAYGFYTVLADQ